MTLNNDMKEGKSLNVKCIHENGLVVMHLGENADREAEERVARFSNTDNPVVVVEGSQP